MAESRLSHRDHDQRLLSLELKLEERARELDDRMRSENRAMLRPPRFGRVTKQLRASMDSLTPQKRILAAKAALGEEAAGILIEPVIGQAYETIATFLAMDISGDTRVYIHEWAFDPDPPKGSRASYRFDTLAELLAAARDTSTYPMGDIVTFITDEDIPAKAREVMEKIKGAKK